MLEYPQAVREGEARGREAVQKRKAGETKRILAQIPIPTQYKGKPSGHGYLQGLSKGWDSELAKERRRLKAQQRNAAGASGSTVGTSSQVSRE